MQSDNSTGFNEGAKRMNKIIYYPIHDSTGKRDKRYTTLKQGVQYNASFCGDWIGSADSANDITDVMEEHQRKRYKEMEKL